MPNNLNACCFKALQLLDRFVCICENGKITWINDKGLQLLRAPNSDSVLNVEIANFVTDDFLELFEDGLGLLSAEKIGIPIKLLSSVGDVIDVHCQVQEFPGNGNTERYFVECQDVSDLLRAAQEIRSRELRMNAIFKAVDQAVITIDEFGMIKAVNDVAVKIFGYERIQMIGQNVNMLMPEPHRSSHDEYLNRYHATGHSSVIDDVRQLEAVRKNGEIFPIELTVTKVAENTGRGVFIGSIRDITILKAREDRIRSLALNDNLTGLPNRASFNDKIEKAVKRALRSQGRVALMFIDLDKFKPINDEIGHDAGDMVLKTVADRLKSQIRDTDMVARLGGDEFVVVLEGVNNTQDVAKVAQKIITEVSKPIEVNDTTCSVGASIGISIFPTNAKTIPELLHVADKAMYKVKEAGRNNFSFV